MKNTSLSNRLPVVFQNLKVYLFFAYVFIFLHFYGFMAHAQTGNNSEVYLNNTSKVNENANAEIANVNNTTVTPDNPKNGISSVTGENTTGFNLYPNPAKDNLIIEPKGHINSSITVNIYNILGQRVMNEKNLTINGQNIFKLDVRALVTGIYILEIEINGQAECRQFMIS